MSAADFQKLLDYMDKRLNQTFADLNKDLTSDIIEKPEETPFEDAAAWAQNQKKKQ